MFYNYRPDGLSEKGMSNQTQAAHWRENGEPDPHAKCTDQERAELPLGNLTDDELANEVFLHGDSQPSIAEVIAGTAKMPIVYLTAAKERIRWLSRKLVGAEQGMQEARTKIANLLMQRSDTGLAIDAAIRDGVVPDEHPLRSRLEMLANHRQREQELRAEVERVNHQINEMPGMNAFDEIDRLRAECSNWEKVLGTVLATIPVKEVTRAAGTVGDAVAYFKRLHQQRDELQAALQLARNMFVANDLILPHTFEVIDEALASSKAE